ncbi:MAG: FUSC family protein [Lapillicoccus sp.]
MTTPTRAQLLERLRQEAPQAVRIVVAAAVGWQICRWIDPGSLPLYAVIVPVVAMRDDPYSAFNTSFDRLLGVVAGIAIGVLVAGWLGPSVYAVSLVLLVGLLGGIVLRVGPSLNVQVSMSALLVFANPDPGQLAVVRLWETLVGAAVTVVLSPLLFPPDSRAAVASDYQEVTRQVARQLSDLGALTAHADRHVPRVLALHDAAQETEHRAEELPLKLAGAQRSVRYNPLRRRHRSTLAAMAAPVGLVVTLAQAARVLVEDVAEFAARPGIGPTWDQVGPHLADVLSETAVAVGTGLTPAGLTPEARQSVAAAAQELERWRAAAPAPLDAVLRRSAYRIVHALEAFDR